MFAVEENIPINRKFFQFSTFSKIPKFYSSGPVSVPIFRPNREGGNFSNWKIVGVKKFFSGEGGIFWVLLKNYVAARDRTTSSEVRVEKKKEFFLIKKKGILF